MSCQELGTLINECAPDAMDDKLAPLMRRLAEQAVRLGVVKLCRLIGMPARPFQDLSAIAHFQILQSFALLGIFVISIGDGTCY